jgi:hypothetical protein
MGELGGATGLGGLGWHVVQGDDAADAGGVALCRVEVLAGHGELGEVALQLPELTNAGGDLRPALLQLIEHVLAWRAAAVADPQDLPNVGQGQPNRLRGSDEPQSGEHGGVAYPVAGRSAARRRQ